MSETMRDRAREAASRLYWDAPMQPTAHDWTNALTTFAKAEVERALERAEQRLIEEHTAGETGDDCTSDFDEGWLSGAWNAVNTLRALKEQE